MKESDAPESQDNTADHGNKPQDGGALGNVPPGIPGNPPAPSEGQNSSNSHKASPWWKKLDTWRFAAEISILVVTLKIAYIYSGQLNQMIEANKLTRNTLNEVQNQTALMRQQLVGTEAAFVRVEYLGQVTPDEDDPSTKKVDFDIRNDGHVLAHNVLLQLEISKELIGGRPSGAPQHRELSIPNMETTDRVSPPRRTYPVRFSMKELEQYRNTKLQIRIDETLQYENGFGEIVKEQICRSATYTYVKFRNGAFGNEGELVPCDQMTDLLEGHRRAQERAKKENQTQ